MLDLKDIYDKVQKKTVEGSEQRVANGVVTMVATATAQISAIRVFVRRNEKAAMKTNDRIGKGILRPVLTSNFLSSSLLFFVAPLSLLFCCPFRF